MGQMNQVYVFGGTHRRPSSSPKKLTAGQTVQMSWIGLLAGAKE